MIKGKYTFTDKERDELGRLLAQKQLDKRIIEDEKKSVMNTYADRLNRFSWEIHKISQGVHDGFEMRDFECRIVIRAKDHLKEFIDIHTNKIVDTRPMDPSDYQIEMDEVPEEPEPVKKTRKRKMSA